MDEKNEKVQGCNESINKEPVPDQGAQQPYFPVKDPAPPPLAEDPLIEDIEPVQPADLTMGKMMS